MKNSRNKLNDIKYSLVVRGNTSCKRNSKQHQNVENEQLLPMVYGTVILEYTLERLMKSDLDSK